jgi:15-cis-phytoene synthase
MLQLPETPRLRPQVSLESSYELCRQVTAHYAKTFYLATLLMSEAKRRAIWAIYVWCRRTDELVDGPEAQQTTLATLEAWEQRLEDVFAGRPHDAEDQALSATVQEFPLDIQPFRDMIAGQRMDLYRSRYQTFEELHLYCYRVAGTVGLMSAAIMGLESHDDRLQVPWRKPYPSNGNPHDQAVALGIAKQLTNILRDVGEDARRGRIYIPQDDLVRFDYTEADLLKGVVDERWRQLMRFQIQRARKYYTEAEIGVQVLNRDARWPVWSALMLYRQILDVIEKDNHFDVFSRRAFVPKSRQLMSLPGCWLRSL